MRRAVLLLATMALATLLASGMAQAIINGEPDTGKGAHPYVGALVTEFEVAEGETELLPACSGTLISPTVFLTAGHCTEFLIAEDLPTFVSFDPTYVPGESELISGTPYLHPRYCLPFCRPGLPGFAAYDVGVVVLDEPVRRATYGELPPAGLVDTLPTGQPLTVVGYGASDIEVGGGPPRDVYLDIRQRADVRLLSTTNRIGKMSIKTSAGGPGRGGEGACRGDSGGPVFLPDQTTIVAVVSFGPNPPCAGVGYAQRIDLQPVLSWISSFL
jgi:Trypsin